MIAAHDSLPTLDFEEPDGIVHTDVCLESGQLATDRCVDVRNEIFIEGTEPTSTCSIHPSTGLYIPRDRDEVSDTTEDRRHF